MYIFDFLLFCLPFLIRYAYINYLNLFYLLFKMPMYLSLLILQLVKFKFIVPSMNISYSRVYLPYIYKILISPSNIQPSEVIIREYQYRMREKLFEIMHPLNFKTEYKLIVKIYTLLWSLQKSDRIKGALIIQRIIILL